MKNSTNLGNAFIALYAQRLPIFIDPQGDARRIIELLVSKILITARAGDKISHNARHGLIICGVFVLRSAVGLTHDLRSDL